MLTAASSENTEVTIDDEMKSDWAAILTKHRDEPEPVEAETNLEVAEEASASLESTDRARDEQGKFAKQTEAKPNANANENKPAPTAPNAAAPVEDTASQNAAPQRDINRAPSTWKPIERAEWDKLTPAVRAAIHRREADFQNGQAQLLPDARLGSEMRKVTEPYRAQIEAGYGSPERAMGEFLKTAGILQMGSSQQKLQEIVRISHQFGIDLNPLFAQGNPQPQQAQEFRDPRVDQLLQQQQQAEQQRQQVEQQTLEQVASVWSAEKDELGNPKRPYLNDVIQDLSVLIPQIRKSNPGLSHTQVLDTAYDRAVWSNPDVRVVLQGQKQTELVQQQALANQERVRDAKRAASVNVPRRASIPSLAKPGKLEDTISATARELGLIT